MLANVWIYIKLVDKWKKKKKKKKKQTNCKLTQFRFGLNCSVFFFTCLILLIIAVVG
ncbi:hypothetical protein PP707_07325 [Acetobacter pasteurianus]|nr:hypothetical protein [Acetobacter pasteurianus]